MFKKLNIKKFCPKARNSPFRVTYRRRDPETGKRSAFFHSELRTQSSAGPPESLFTRLRRKWAKTKPNLPQPYSCDPEALYQQHLQDLAAAGCPPYATPHVGWESTTRLPTVEITTPLLRHFPGNRRPSPPFQMSSGAPPVPPFSLEENAFHQPEPLPATPNSKLATVISSSPLPASLPDPLNRRHPAPGFPLRTDYSSWPTVTALATPQTHPQPPAGKKTSSTPATSKAPTKPMNHLFSLSLLSFTQSSVLYTLFSCIMRRYRLKMFS